MTPRLDFHQTGLGREVAMLGERRVGEVWPADMGRPRIAWTVSLADYPRRGGPAGTIEAARKAIADEVAEWLASMNLIDIGSGVEIRLVEPDTAAMRDDAPAQRQVRA